MTYRTVVVLILAVTAASCSFMRRSSPPERQPEAATATIPEPQTEYQKLSSHGYMMEAGASSVAPVPPMEPNRPINTQDCTKEINTVAGNLKCQ